MEAGSAPDRTAEPPPPQAVSNTAEQAAVRARPYRNLVMPLMTGSGPPRFDRGNHGTVTCPARLAEPLRR
ncbi:hypothetical protein GCM10023334_069930 [Nonomuraea thailandensis]